MHASELETIRGHTFYAAPLAADSVIIDLGAYRGEFSQHMHARYGGTYHLVEANSALASKLPNTESFRVWNCAVGNTNGPIRFNIAHNDEGSSILNLP